MNNQTEKYCYRCCQRNTAAVLCDTCVAEMRKGYIGKTYFKKTTIGNRHYGEWVSYQREPMSSAELLKVVIDLKVVAAMQRRKEAAARAVPSHFEQDTYSNAYDDDDMDEGAWT